MVDETIDGGKRHGGIGEDPVPFPEGLVGGDHDGSPLVARGDELEEHARFRLVLGDIGEIVEDEQIELVELGDGGFELEFTTRHLEFLNEFRRAHEQYPPAVLDQREADCGGEMALAATRRAEQQDVRSLGEPAIAGGDRHDLCLGDHRHGVEVKAAERLSRWQPRLGEMALDAAAIALGKFVLGNRGQEARRWPPFLVGPFGKIRREDLDGRQSEFIEQRAEPGCVDGEGVSHAASSRWRASIRT